jgi:drug/metabolite transporter (DMT)-like permease
MQQVKHEYQPSSLFLYFSVNGVTFVLSLIVSILTWNIKYFIDFALEHDRLLVDLTSLSLLTALGALFAFKLVNTFRQHIYPLVSNTRKCVTVCINVLWFGHHLAKMQWLGIAIVFGGIMMEIINNYNLASKILPNNDVRSREGEKYNKIIPKE